MIPDSPAAVAERLGQVDYLADEGLATALFLALQLPQPLLLEGEAGVGKTEAAKALAAALDTPLIRLQCYEGIDVSEALYEWNYPRQLLRIRLAEASREDVVEEDLFGDAYLIRRPLLQAIEHPGPLPAVLLIDELDRADHDFEAFLLELLAEAAVTIPELGTVRATHPPAVILTSNRTRDLHDALKRRCLYHWIDYPSPAREVEIVRRRVPGAARELAEEVAGAVARLRAADVQKPPGIAEAIDWVAALRLLGAERLDAEAADRTLGAVLKYREDQEAVRAAGLEGDPVSHFARALERDAPFAAVALGRALHDAGLPVTPDRSARFAAAASLARPRDRSELYWTARLTFVSSQDQLPAFDAVFGAVVDGLVDPSDTRGQAGSAAVQAAPRMPREVTSTRSGGEPPSGGVTRPSALPGQRGEGEEVERPVASVASDAERLASTEFGELEPAELQALAALLRSLAVAPPPRRARRARIARRGERLDVRATLRRAQRTAGDPVVQERRRRRMRTRPLVALLDVSGSMEPYARAYLLFLEGAARGARAETFVFATRLTRVTKALRDGRPHEALDRAARAAPDWSGGTKIGEALKAFNDRHGRRGAARDAVVVVLSDGWERGDPALVSREMSRLRRLAYRIVWVNPRVAAAGFQPLAGGMAAALPYVDELLSGHNAHALEEVIEAIGRTR